MEKIDHGGFGFVQFSVHLLIVEIQHGYLFQFEALGHHRQYHIYQNLCCEHQERLELPCS